MTEHLKSRRAFFTLHTSQGQNDFVGRNESFDAEEAIHLIAVAGDNTFHNPNNSGLKTFEVALVPGPGPQTDAWTLQTLGLNKENHGHESQLFFGSLFIFFGVKTETLGSNPNPWGGAGPRYLYTGTNSPATIINSQQSSSDAPATSTYYQSVRIKSFVFAIGGNDGSGPIATIDRGH